jgi:lipoprotein NlpD
MKLPNEGRLGPILVTLVMVALAGCSSPTRKAPVEDRSAAARPATDAPAPPAVEAPGKPLPGIENAGKPGYYTVKPGDTLLRISLDQGQNWRDLARWNNLENPNLLEVGQVLRITPPAADPGAATARAVPGAGRVESRPLDSKPGAVTAGTGATTAAPAPPALAAAVPSVPPATVPPATVPAPTAPAPNAAGSAAAVPAPVGTAPPATAGPGAAPRDAGEDLVWSWPASGAVVAGFDEGRNKGLTIAGKAGDPVLAAGDGRVVYAGASLRGYGNLVIVKHNELYLTAYAHNQVLLVKDDQVVRRGQKIAEMGSSDAERVQLHFEIRRQGKPVDPAKLLPAR